MLLSFGGVAPEQAVAHTKVLLQFPAGTEPEEAIRTDLEVLRTHAVAQAAVQALGLEQIRRFSARNMTGRSSPTGS